MEEVHKTKRVRVFVMSGDQDTVLGFGWHVDDVTVYVIVKPDGKICTLENAEEKPSDEQVAEVDGELIEITDNPKIILDDGQIVYGCQVWWSECQVETN